MSEAVDSAVLSDLSRSGLTPNDINARDLGTPEVAAIGLRGEVSGYVIPYYSLSGNPVGFYRVRLFNTRARYLQPKNTSNHVYFPPNLHRLLNTSPPPRYIVITEGEKKASAAVKAGIPAVAFGGVDSWRNRNAALPSGTELFNLHQNQNAKGSLEVGFKLPSNTSIEQLQDSTLAIGLLDLINYAIQHNTTLIIVYDSNYRGETPFDVQRAASALGFELRFQGLPYSNIRQLTLPIPTTWIPEDQKSRANGHPPELSPDTKVGLDDYLEAEPDAPEALKSLLEQTLEQLGTFPVHPNTRDFVNKRLSRSKLPRKEAQQIAMAVLCDLDAKGRRLKSTAEEQTYYFDYQTKRLLRVRFNFQNRGLLHETSFGQLLYQRYGLSAGDQRLLGWLDAQFNSEEPLQEVTPSKVLAPTHDNLGINTQLSDSSYIRVTDKTKQVLDNGQDGVLFEANQVVPVSTHPTEAADDSPAASAIKCWWLDVLRQVRLRDTSEQTLTVIALLYYISPWLNRWRGTQLPVEIITGEPGSGKSSLYELRLRILTGEASLRNAPTDIRDWNASIASTGGMHVTDNLHLVDKNLRQRLSDELCRIVTAPYPHVEMRKLYSTAELIKLPVSVTFAITAVTQPFQNPDILQRAFVIELDKSRFGDDVRYDHTWVQRMLAKPSPTGSLDEGRSLWLNHHLEALHRFFKLAREKWDPSYQATNRLINVEQALMLMGEVFGLDTAWLPQWFSRTESRTISEADWVMEGLEKFAELVVKSKKTDKPFAARDVSDWALQQEDFEDCIQLTNPRKLGRYMLNHEHQIKQLTGIEKAGTIANRTVYRVTQ